MAVCVRMRLRLNKCVNCDHLSRDNEPLVWKSAICLGVLTYLIWIPWSKFIGSNNQSRFTRCVGETRLLHGHRSCVNILITTSLSSKNEHGRSLAGDMCAWRIMWMVAFLVLVLRTGFLPTGGSNSSTNWAPELPPILDQRPTREFRLRCCWVKRLIASCKFNFLEQMCVFPKCTTYPMTWISSQSRPEKNLTCILMQCFPQDSTVSDHLWNECWESIWPSVCHKLYSIWW